MLRRKNSLNKVYECVTKVKRDVIPEGNSLCCFPPKNKFRIKLFKLVENEYYKNSIILTIVVSTISLAFTAPLNDPTETFYVFLDYVDKITTYIFAIEALTKIIALGLLCNGKKSYLR